MQKGRPIFAITILSLAAIIGQTVGHPVLNSTAVNWDLHRQLLGSSRDGVAHHVSNAANLIDSSIPSFLSQSTRSRNHRHYGNTDDFVKAARAEDAQRELFTNPPFNLESVPLTRDNDDDEAVVNPYNGNYAIPNDAKYDNDVHEETTTTYITDFPMIRDNQLSNSYAELVTRPTNNVPIEAHDQPVSPTESTTTSGPDDDEYDEVPEKAASDVAGEDGDDDGDEDDDEEGEELGEARINATVTPKLKEYETFESSDGPQMTEEEFDKKERDSDRFLNAKEASAEREQVARTRAASGLRPVPHPRPVLRPRLDYY
ncbi:hypothetical protein HDE_11879 [Halotydeus destructor]|nr:hypothetical protein HDE_11879 [Halotydeus destructor]